VRSTDDTRRRISYQDGRTVGPENPERDTRQARVLSVGLGNGIARRRLAIL